MICQEEEENVDLVMNDVVVDDANGYAHVL